MLQTVWRRIGSSKIGATLARRPRLTMTLLLLVVLIAMQGGAVAETGDTLYDGVSTQDGKTTDTGP